ncbi:MAG: hypothetical protein JWO06_2124, partial [Bacteroidota bacterium]|nr:hypothetical protein [Bacteroidota bacterium]
MQNFLLKTLVAVIISSVFYQITYGQGDNKIDTLILNNNEHVIGQVENLYEIITQDGNIIKKEFKIDTAWSKKISVPLSEVKYVKAYGTTFEQVELNGGAHQLLEVVSKGKATLYLWRKITLVPGASMVNPFNENKSFKPASGIITESEMETYIVFEKDKMNYLTPLFVKR